MKLNTLGVMLKLEPVGEGYVIAGSEFKLTIDVSLPMVLRRIL